MLKFQKEHWKRFEQSGQIADYLNYIGAQRGKNEGSNAPLRRIEESSLYKKFY